MSVENEKEFIDVFVFVPVILAFHNSQPHDGVVHFTKSLVVPLVFAGIDEFLHVDQFERSVQNVQECFVRKIFDVLLRGHKANLTTEFAEFAEKTEELLRDLRVLRGERRFTLRRRSNRSAPNARSDVRATERAICCCPDNNMIRQSDYQRSRSK